VGAVPLKANAVLIRADLQGQSAVQLAVLATLELSAARMDVLRPRTSVASQIPARPDGTAVGPEAVSP
jgi:hypothetical protein